jgi:cell division septation protein DedD
MHSHVIRTVVLLAAIACLAEPSEAQTEVAGKTPLPLSANDSIFRRARRMVSDGNGASGRALVDSMIRVSAEGSPQYGDAIFWRGALAETAAEAERDYRRVIVEYPLSPYADDALLSLAELEQARGDRTAAYQHLQRFVREHPVSPARARAGLAAARLAFEQRDTARGCAMIADARTSVGSSDVELRNQIEYYGGRCPTTASAPESGPAVVASGAPSATATAAAALTPATVASKPTAAPREAVAKAEPVKPATAKHATSKPAPPPAAAARSTSSKSDSGRVRATPVTSVAPRGTWTIQLAAYNTRPDAERLVAKLASRGVKARISGEAKPFRVRLDFYATQQEAATAVAELKARGIIGFVTEEARPGAGSSP